MDSADDRAKTLAARAKALESLLVERGLLTTEMVDRVADVYEHRVGPRGGARVVARAWTDPEFKARLLDDATAACAELGVGGPAMQVCENTASVHNVIVCTLCSCYPWSVLGLPPNWYKYPAYRARIVREPRVVLRDEFGLVLDDDVEIVVWDSSAETRYWVLPERPAGADGCTAEQLADLVTRDSMIGVGRPLSLVNGDAR